MHGDGGYNGPGNGRSALPFLKDKVGDAIYVHFAVVTTEESEQQQVAAEVAKALQALRVGGRRIVATVSRDNVKMTAAQIKDIATAVLPDVLQQLGIDRINHEIRRT